jgi:thymidylate synthase
MTTPTIRRAEEQYLDHFSNIFHNGVDQLNARTGKSTRTLINLDMTYDASTNEAPLLTSREIKNPYLSIAELLGYIKGTSSAAEFRKLGTKSWDENANKNAAWLANPNREGEDDVGMIYGGVAKNWPVEPNLDGTYPTIHPNAAGQSPNTLDLFRKVYNNIKNGIDDRGEIITFWNPGMFHLGALRPCMYEHQFSLLGDDLYLNSLQRSSDWPLGTVANMVQVWLLLRLFAQITGKNPKLAQHRNVNCHIYDNQLHLVEEHLSRKPLTQPTIDINPAIKTLEDLETWVTINDFTVTYPESHSAIKYPFAV